MTRNHEEIAFENQYSISKSRFMEWEKIPHMIGNKKDRGECYDTSDGAW